MELESPQFVQPVSSQMSGVFMHYVIDLTEMSLLDLLELRCQALLGTLELDEQGLLLLFSYTENRAKIVEGLERAFA